MIEDLFGAPVSAPDMIDAPASSAPHDETDDGAETDALALAKFSRQPALPLPPAAMTGAMRWAPGAPNAEAQALVEAAANGRGRSLAVVGGPASGKTTLLRLSGLRQASHRVLAEGADAVRLIEGRRAQGLWFDDVDRALAAADGAEAAQLEQGLFHVLNRSAAEQVRLVLVGRAPPARWPVRLRDLATRLATLPVARIEAPDDALLADLLSALFARRGLRVEATTVQYLTRRMPRDYQAVQDIVAALDEASLAAQRPVTIPLAKATFGWRDAEA